MNAYVLVDTTVWSLAYRRRAGFLDSGEERIVAGLRGLAIDGRARLIGPVRQELLSGIRERADFEILRRLLRGFPDEPLKLEDYESAAGFMNRCRGKGIAGSATDFLICSVSIKRGWPVYTTDPDFSRYARIIDLEIYAHSQ